LTISSLDAALWGCWNFAFITFFFCLIVFVAMSTYLLAFVVLTVILLGRAIKEPTR
jgi:hypothetical protein